MNKEACKMNKGAVLFMVHRGKYSEGYNFKDYLCRGILMIGVPNKNIQEPKIIMKKIFYNSDNNLWK